MPETVFKAQPIQIRYVCDKCGKAEMMPTPGGKPILTPQGPLIPHTCGNKFCGEVKGFHVMYPVTTFIRGRALAPDEINVVFPPKEVIKTGDNIG